MKESIVVAPKTISKPSFRNMKGYGATMKQRIWRKIEIAMPVAVSSWQARYPCRRLTPL